MGLSKKELIAKSLIEAPDQESRNRRRKRRLDDLQQRLDDLTRLVSDWVWETGPDLRLIEISPRVFEILRLHPTELEGHTLSELGVFKDGGAAGEAMSKRRPFRDAMFEIASRDGTPHQFLISGLPVYDPESGDQLGMRGTAEDVTERLKSEQELRRANDELERRVEERTRELAASRTAAQLANRAKSQFLANMSHELRTPLNAILGFAEVMVQKTFGPLGDEHYDDYATSIYQAGNHLHTLLGDILDISRIELGTADFRESAIDVERTLRACVNMVRQRAEQAGINLRADISPTATNPLIADEKHLKQIVLNLLSNAIKFTPRGGTVEVAAGLNDGCWRIRVSDTGIGIHANDVERVFMAFGQVADTYERDHGGTGLGLTISKSLVELHDGTLELESEPGKGTALTITFPRRRTAAKNLPRGGK